MPKQPTLAVADIALNSDISVFFQSKAKPNQQNAVGDGERGDEEGEAQSPGIREGQHEEAEGD